MIIQPDIFERYRGVRFISDVHGQFDNLSEVLIKCSDDGMFPVSLGDLVDRGPNSKDCLSVFLNLMDRGLGLMIPGNHELKQWKRLNGGAETRWLPDHQRTHEQILSMTRRDLNLFADMMEREQVWGRIGNLYFAHASFSPLFVDAERRTLTPKEIKQLKQHSYYGHLTGDQVFKQGARKSDGLDWIDKIPTGYSMVVGHTVLCVDMPSATIIQSSNGSRAYLIDSGCGSFHNGYISTLDYLSNGTIWHDQSFLDATFQHRLPGSGIYPVGEDHQADHEEHPPLAHEQAG